jgi:CRP-like cAMP-binding protein
MLRRREGGPAEAGGAPLRLPRNATRLPAADSTVVAVDGVDAAPTAGGIVSMEVGSAEDVVAGNALLAALPVEARGLLVEGSSVVHLEQRHVVWEPGQEAEHVYFPLSGVVSLVTVMADGDMVETATVGREGMVGLHHFLGSRAMRNVQAISQVAGDSIEVDAAAFREASEREGPLRQLLERYALLLLVGTAQEVACNRLHSLEMRCARWLMTTRDQIGDDEFGLTQEFLAQMLGVRRATVTLAAGMLQKAGLIRYRRGWIEIRNPEGLGEAACECYGVIRNEFDSFLAEVGQHSA